MSNTEIKLKLKGLTREHTINQLVARFDVWLFIYRYKPISGNKQAGSTKWLGKYRHLPPAWRPEFNPLNPHGRRGAIPAKYPHTGTHVPPPNTNNNNNNGKKWKWEENETNQHEIIGDVLCFQAGHVLGSSLLYENSALIGFQFIEVTKKMCSLIK